MYNEVKQADTWKPSIIRFDLDFVFRATDYQESLYSQMYSSYKFDAIFTLAFRSGLGILGRI